MGGHGGLNILPQKRWNVYRFDNMEKVRQDEEAAAKEEQLRRERERRQEAEFRLERLRATRGLVPLNPTPEAASETASEPASEPAKLAKAEPKMGHINLFEGIKIFDPIERTGKKDGKDQDGPKKKKMKKEEAPRVITPEDEKYRLGYGVAGKGVKLPWYLEKKSDDVEDERSGDADLSKSVKKNGKKSLTELREERMKREKREKEREVALISERGRRRGPYLRDEREMDRVGRRGMYSQDSRYSRR